MGLADSIVATAATRATDAVLTSGAFGVADSAESDDGVTSARGAADVADGVDAAVTASACVDFDCSTTTVGVGLPVVSVDWEVAVGSVTSSPPAVALSPALLVWAPPLLLTVTPGATSVLDDVEPGDVAPDVVAPVDSAELAAPVELPDEPVSPPALAVDPDSALATGSGLLIEPEEVDDDDEEESDAPVVSAAAQP